MYSIIISVRDRTEELARCLVGVLWQDFGDYEIIVVDYGAEPPIRVPEGVRLIRWEADEWNQSIALNIGIANTLGDRLIILNADIIMAPDLLGVVDELLNENIYQRRYWQRFDLTPKGQQALEDLNSRGIRHLFKSDVSKAWQHKGLGQWGARDNLGDFLAVEKAPIVKLGGYDERMAGWGYYDIDMDHRLRKLDYEHQIGRSFKLIHQHHSPQPGYSVSNSRNWNLSATEMAAGRKIRNGGPRNFERYRI